MSAHQLPGAARRARTTSTPRCGEEVVGVPGHRRERMPSAVSDDTRWFDRFAEATSRAVSRSLFFGFAAAMVIVWLPSYLLFGDFNTWQLAINTPTTIGTWLLVALLQNATRRGDQATQHKLNAVAAALAELMRDQPDLDEARRELRAAVGLEERESA